MAEAKTVCLSCILWLIICCGGNEISTKDIYTNLWAVKAHGSVEDVGLLALKHGFLYDKHVSLRKLSSAVDFMVHKLKF